MKEKMNGMKMDSEEKLLKKCRNQVGNLLDYGGGLDDPPVLSVLARRRLNKVRDRLEEVVNNNVVGVEVLELLAKVYERLEEYGKAVEMSERASNFDPKEVDNLRAAAWCALADGNLDVSDDYCRQALVRGPHNGVLNVNFAIIRLLKEDISGARDALRLAFNAGDDHSAAAVCGVIDWCEVCGEPLPTTYTEYLYLLSKTKAIDEWEREGNRFSIDNLPVYSHEEPSLDAPEFEVAQEYAKLEEEALLFWKKNRLYWWLSCGGSVISGGVIWYVFRYQETALLAIILVVVATWMPYALWDNSLHSLDEHPRWVRYLSYALIIFVLACVIFFAGFAFELYG